MFGALVYMVAPPKKTNIHCIADVPLTSAQKRRVLQISRSYELWLPEWENHLYGTPDIQLVPPSASVTLIPH